MIKICLGCPAYGTQVKSFWAPLVEEAAGLHRDGIELVKPLAVSGMMTDLARNKIVSMFLDTEAEWLMWVDADNAIPRGAVKRLLETHRSLVTGIYVRRDEEKPEPLLYFKDPSGSFKTLKKWRKGEILPIDAAGLGGCLMSRTVAEDIRTTYRILERVEGGHRAFHKDDIQGDVFDASAETDGKVVDGVLHERLRIPTLKHDFPWFMIEYGNTEDYGFFEKARRSGHQLWADTSVELGHIGEMMFKPEMWLQR